MLLRRTNLGFSFALIVFVTIGTISYASLRALIAVTDEVAAIREETAVINRLTDQLTRGDAAAHGYAMTGDPHLAGEARGVAAQLPGMVERVRAAVAEDTLGRRLAGALAPLVDRRLAAIHRLLEARVQGEGPPALARLAAPWTAQSDSIRALVIALTSSGQRRLDVLLLRRATQLDWASVAILAATLLGLLTVLLAMVLVNRGAASRARADAALREAQERSRVILSTAVDGILAIDERGVIEGLNPAAERLFGWPETELLGRNVTVLMPEPHASRHPSHLASYLATGEAHVLGRTREILGRRHDGTAFPIELSVGEVRLDDRRLFTGIVRDITERKGLETTLRDTLALQQAILDSANNSIISSDPEGTIRTFNATAERWLGYRAEEVVGRAALAVFHDHDEVARRADELSKRFGVQIPSGFDALAEEARRGIPSQWEWTYVRKDGSRFPVLLSVTALRDADGAVAGFLGIASDLDARHAAEAARRASEERYRSVVEALGEGLFVLERSGRIVEANASAERLLGVTREELVGRPFDEVPWETIREDGSPLPPDERPATFCLRTGQPVRNAVIGERRKDGTVVWLLVNVQPMAFASDGLPAAAVTLLADITRRREVERALRDNQARLQDFLDNAHDFIFSTAPDGRLLYVNRAWEEALGYGATDVVGRNVSDFLDAACLDRCRDAFRRIVAGETIGDIEAVFVARDGRRISVFGSSNCRIEGGRPIATRSIFRDITEIRRTQEALERARDEAERANKAKSDFLANMSHELRTPLNSVIGFANVLRKNKARTFREEDLVYLSRIQENGKHLLALINSILDLSKVEAGRVELELEAVDLERLVRDALALVGGQARPEVRLAAEVPAVVRPVRADAAKLKQVLVNLLGNALRFTERGHVIARVVADAATGEALALEVEDTGIGIPKGRQAAVFEAFQQADGSTARRFGGTGLGLTISRSFVQLMGYRLGVESEEGKGSTFRIVFRESPTAAAPAEAPAPAEVPAAPAGAPTAEDDEFRDRVVLVIDDEADSRLLLSQLVTEVGARAVTAGSGAEGLRLARERHPHLVTVDLLMPEMTGWDVVRAMRDDPALADIPVVVASIVASERGGTVLGAVDLLNKPVERDQLLTVLRRQLRSGPPRVLIVEDDADARHLLATYLADVQADVQSAANGREALELLATFTPDLMLVDLMMPEMDGLTFLERVRGQPGLAGIPAVVVTAKELEADERRRLERHAAAVLCKGEDLERSLREAVRATLRRRAAPGW